MNINSYECPPEARTATVRVEGPVFRNVETKHQILRLATAWGNSAVASLRMTPVKPILEELGDRQLRVEGRSFLPPIRSS